MAANVWRIFAGRFQPFHNGHLWIVRQLVEKYGRLIIGIVNPDPANPPDIEYPSFHPVQNPFGYWERLQMIRGAVAAEGLLDGVIIVPLQHPRAELGSDQAFLPHQRKWVVPPLDEHETDKIMDLQKLGEEVEEVEVPEEYRFLSSSLIRNCLLEKKTSCLSIAAASSHPCCPEAVSVILRTRSAVLRIGKLVRQHAKEGQAERRQCPKLAAHPERSVVEARAIAKELSVKLSECRQKVDTLDPELKRRTELKRDQIMPLEERLKNASEAGNMSEIEKIGTDIVSLHQRLSTLLAKKGG